jgi:hypothetical protein
MTGDVGRTPASAPDFREFRGFSAAGNDPADWASAAAVPASAAPSPVEALQRRARARRNAASWVPTLGPGGSALNLVTVGGIG